MKKILFISFFIVSNFTLFADGILTEREFILEAKLNKLRSAINKHEKDSLNSDFKAYLNETILLDGAFDYPFDKLQTIGKIKSPDNFFRIFTWNVVQEDEQNKYYCLVLTHDKKKQISKSIELIDRSDVLPKKPEGIINPNMWYGTLYYKIIPTTKGNKTYYTVFGLNKNGKISNIKVIDVFTFSGNNQLKIGSPIFKMKGETLKRIFFEYSAESSMSIKYEENRQRIVFDHLSPESPNMVGMYEYYVPDLSYDAFILNDDKWYFKEDIVAVNEKGKEKISIITADEKTGKIVEKKLKNKWEDPSVGGTSMNVHKSALPEEPIFSKSSNKKLKSKKQNVPLKSEKNTKSNITSKNSYKKFK